MPWLQLRINTTRELAPRVEYAMAKSGSLAVTLQDNADHPIFEPALGETPLWQETRIVGLFEADTDTAAILELVLKKSGLSEAQHQWHILEDKDWEREWMTHYQPIQCGPAFWICPSWTAPPDPNAVNLMLDPGLAFGTGTHPTTFLCLQWLAGENLNNKTVIDYGCGSGILGIGALLLGAASVTGTDIDPQALMATQDNVKRNNLPAVSFPVYFPDNCPAEPVDYMLANILAGPLVELAPTLSALLKPGGRLCLSGVLETQKDDLLAAYEATIEIEQVLQREEWICITGTRRALKSAKE
ncbi:50S ribosomal protein L11 methyltransferase [Teredinibacter turnerae]|uniref:50S ribosomal protein L11 methyltransferase n=1 Tax=Teredinibacter turnerae TaxID=2426 RepID=UPI00040149D3|nr:50S ribosomal protein L11 methyltransferase [Teredinibacter turnerae]